MKTGDQSWYSPNLLLSFPIADLIHSWSANIDNIKQYLRSCTIYLCPSESSEIQYAIFLQIKPWQLTGVFNKPWAKFWLLSSSKIDVRAQIEDSTQSWSRNSEAFSNSLLSLCLWFHLMLETPYKICTAFKLMMEPKLEPEPKSRFWKDPNQKELSRNPGAFSKPQIRLCLYMS